MKLEVNNLTQRFDSSTGAGIAVLNQLEFSTGNIQALVLIGPSGGGKSTLLRILAGLDLPVTGSVAFDGQVLPRDEAHLRAYRKTIGTVFQAYNLFPHLSALDNLLLPLVHVHGLSKPQAEARVREPLERFQLMAHAYKRPAELSGGQKQRIAILRALVVEPQCLFLDEPTSALDPEMTAEVLEMIGELKASGTNFVLVTHEMAFARQAADEVAFIGDGCVLAHGTADEIFSRCMVPRVKAFLGLSLFSTERILP